ncbi:MAG: NAD(P)-dependent alcohol dehydrogenase [Bacteroidetes bacterium]|nr:NAD(P)-dependent alcohol dehydrogenase [Bacteroidota bacterium]
MKAAVYTQYGPPEVVEVKQVAIPIPKDNEVLIKVYATTVNRTDCGFRSAEYFIVRFFSGLLRPKNRTLGNEFAGEVVSTGKEVHLFRKGDRVFGYNDVQFGAHAEYMVMAEKGPIATIPEHLSYEEAAPLIEGSHYAWCDLQAAKLSAGQDILVNGATGAIGSAAVQLSKYIGAHVVAVCDTQNRELVQSLGADVVMDYTREDFTKTDRRFDVAFDAVGKSSFGRCKALLKKKGVYMSTELGYLSQNIFLALLTPFFGGRKVLFPIPTIDKKDVEFFKELAVNNSFKPVIDRVYSLDQIVEAYTYVETGQKIGNVIIRIAPY